MTRNNLLQWCMVTIAIIAALSNVQPRVGKKVEVLSASRQLVLILWTARRQNFLLEQKVQESR